MFNQPIPPVTKNLLIINGLFFLATYVFAQSGTDLVNVLAAYYPGSANFRPWQILTHMFMHADISHIAFNMFALWMFGSTVETTLGAKKFIILYFAAGLGAFALFNLVNFIQIEQLKSALVTAGIDPVSVLESFKINSSGVSNTTILQAKELVNYYTTPMVGASGAIYGVLVAFGVLYPDAKLALLFFPVPVKAKYFIPVLIAIEFFLGLENYAWNPVAHFAHIGGAVIGFILVWGWKKNLRRQWY